MTDRELLELAAKAAGYLVRWDGIFCEFRHSKEGQGNGPFWNPLDEDGDALRLAVKLGISIEPYPIYDQPKHSVITKQRRRCDLVRKENPTKCIEVYGADPMAATRRAIVRAAAEIGQAMLQSTETN